MGKIYLVKAGEGWEWGIVLEEHFKEKNSLCSGSVMGKSYYRQSAVKHLLGHVKESGLFFFKRQWEATGEMYKVESVVIKSLDSEMRLISHPTYYLYDLGYVPLPQIPPL